MSAPWLLAAGSGRWWSWQRWRLGEAGAADAAEVRPQVAFKQAQHHGVTPVDGGAGGGYGGGVLTAKSFAEQRQGPRATAVGRAYKQAGVAHAAWPGAMGDQPAHQLLVVNQGEADAGLQPLRIDRRLQLWRGIQVAHLGPLRL
jgi:hypothetical protein